MLADTRLPTNRQDQLELIDDRLFQRSPDQPVALLLVDVRRFFRINHAFGYRVGDQLLEELLQRLQAVVKQNGICLRWGGSSILLLLDRIISINVVRLALEKIQRALIAPFLTHDHNLRLQINIGVACCPDDAQRSESLLLCAETALQAAKKQGTLFQYFRDLTEARQRPSWDIESALQRAIAEDQLSLHYQPKVRLKDLRVSGAEALCRWHHPKHGMIPPDLFIPIAEETGLIEELTRWCINAALRDACAWPDPKLQVAVNISAGNVHSQEVLDAIFHSLKVWDRAPESLVLEVTESTLMTDPETSNHHLNQLKRAGIHIAIDDFGTGYSSLAYFKKIPATELKIDKSFTQRMLDDEGDLNIVRLVTDLAHYFGLGVIAEGVEDSATLRVLRGLRCDAVQGYYFSRPLPQAEFIAWLKAYQSQLQEP